MAILAALVAACTHKSSLASLTEAGQGRLAAADLLPQAGECPPPAPSCPGDYEPALCMARTIAGMNLSESERPMGWGTNSCLAKAQMVREACRAHHAPRLLGEVFCIPDTSEGGCPPEPANCPDEPAPSSCTANAYDGQNLTREALPEATAPNPCLARFALFASACRRNLNPRLLQRISCHSSPHLELPAVK